MIICLYACNPVYHLLFFTLDIIPCNILAPGGKFSLDLKSRCNCKLRPKKPIVWFIQFSSCQPCIKLPFFTSPCSSSLARGCGIKFGAITSNCRNMVLTPATSDLIRVIDWNNSVSKNFRTSGIVFACSNPNSWNFCKLFFINKFAVLYY